MFKINNLHVAAMSATLISSLSASSLTLAQEIESQSTLEEVVVVGSQIKGASISGALPVSVFSIEDIEAIGIESGDDLLANIAEMGRNEFNEAGSTSGSINSSRGDIGAYNLRNLGVGNTLVMLNGRRLVNDPGYQSEAIGGGFTPVSTVNSNLVPTFGLQQVEILRDGASAIYGADAVAGVVNNVTRKDFDGLTMSARQREYGNDLQAKDSSFSLQFGKDMNEGRTNFSMSYAFVDKEGMRASEDSRWAMGDLRSLIPEGSAHADNAFFDNTSSQGLLGQFDMIESSSRVPSALRDYVDSSGEFQVLALDDARCAASEDDVTDVYDTGYGTCIVSDSSTNSTPSWNKNTQSWVRGDTERHNLFMSFNHELANGISLYNEAAYYKSSYYAERNASSQYPFKLRISAASYYNPLRSSASLAADFDPDAELYIDNYRFAEKPRTVNVDKKTYRFLQGVSGSFDNWNYDGALVISKAESRDVNGNRVDLQLMQNALFDTTVAGYNFLCDPRIADCSTNLEQALTTISKTGTSDLKMIDFKLSTPELFSTSAGAAAFLVGVEYREESYTDDRDELSDGTIQFQHLLVSGTCQLGDSSTGAMLDKADLAARCTPEDYTFPYTTSVAGGTPTADSSGERDTTSVFLELDMPLSDSISTQLAVRYEDTSDFGSEVVGKFAIGWNVSDSLLLRASASTAFRAPNLVAMNQPYLQRFNSDQSDWSKTFTENDSGQLSNWIYRRALGLQDLEAETSENISFGLVFEPIENLTMTADFYQITKESGIGNLGTTNETALDFLTRYRDAEANGFAAFADAEAALAVCNNLAASQYNARVIRNDADADDWGSMGSAAQSLGLCPLGDISRVESNYENLAERTVEGLDIGVYYEFDTEIGQFSTRYQGSFTTKLEQLAKPGTDADILNQAVNSGEMSAAVEMLGGSSIATVNINGYNDILGTDGNFEDKHTARISWRKASWSASLTALRVGEFSQSKLTLADGTEYMIDAMTTFNVAASYRFDLNDIKMKVTLGSTNITDERAPLASDNYGYYSDVHNDYGRSIYLDVKATF